MTETVLPAPALSPAAEPAAPPTPGNAAFSRPSGWTFYALAVAALVLIPVAVTFSSFADLDAGLLGHMGEFVLPELLLNTFWLVLGVGLGVSIVGTSLAWLVAMCEFPGRRFFDWALLLPLALPAYVTAFVAVGLLDFTGPLQTWLREDFGLTGFPQIRSRGGVILVMTAALYPYVYFIAKNAFATQGAVALEAAQSLGLTRTRGFFRVALPIAQPWIAAGLMLAYAGRQRLAAWMVWVQRTATLGYAFPGAVLAVGFFIPVAALDNLLIDGLRAGFGIETTAVLKGTLAIMLLAYLVRFLAVGFGPIDSGLGRITRSVDDAARTLGTRTPGLIARIHLPMLRASLASAAALAFVDIMKEMPITLMTRPFGWDTLAVRVFEMTSEGEWERAALPALAIVVAGVVPILLLTRTGRSHG